MTDWSWISQTAEEAPQWRGKSSLASLGTKIASTMALMAGLLQGWAALWQTDHSKEQIAATLTSNQTARNTQWLVTDWHEYEDGSIEKKQAALQHSLQFLVHNPYRHEDIASHINTIFDNSEALRGWHLTILGPLPCTAATQMQLDYMGAPHGMSRHSFSLADQEHDSSQVGDIQPLTATEVVSGILETISAGNPHPEQVEETIELGVALASLK